ncbi:hypothetical protein ZWY2020_017188 [Hordeum vulgare]|nr:hypothetical protein ZWY2020_017188 [Hordeum vulgare]
MRHPIMGSCKVTAINYKHGTMKVIPLVESLSHCPIQKIISTSLSTDYSNIGVRPLSNSEDQTPYVDEHASLLCCSREFTPSAEAYNFAGPISCLNDMCSLSYLVAAQASVYVLPLDCKVAFHGIRIPRAYNKDDEYSEDLTFNERANRIINFSETTLAWSVRNITDMCIQCEQEGRHCGFSSQRRLVFCQRHGSRVKTIAVTTSTAIFLVILSVVATVFYRSLKSKYDEESRTVSGSKERPATDRSPAPDHGNPQEEVKSTTSSAITQGMVPPAAGICKRHFLEHLTPTASMCVLKLPSRRRRRQKDAAAEPPADGVGPDPYSSSAIFSLD